MKLVRQFTSEPAIETLKLFRRLLCCWWTGNGDAHLKNFSVVTGADGLVKLSPAYDQLCTPVVIPNDQLALPVGGKRDGLRRQHWTAFGEYCNLPERSIARELQRPIAATQAALATISRSPLSDRLKTAYADLIRSRNEALLES